MIGDGDKSHFCEFQEILDKVLLVSGCFNLTFCLSVAVFFAVQFLRRSKIAWLNLLGLALVMLCSALIGLFAFRSVLGVSIREPGMSLPEFRIEANLNLIFGEKISALDGTAQLVYRQGYKKNTNCEHGL